MIVLNSVSELAEFLNKNTLPTLVGKVVFSGDLLAQVRNHSNQIGIDEDIGFVDDGGWIEVDENGVVIDDTWLP